MAETLYEGNSVEKVGEGRDADERGRITPWREERSGKGKGRAGGTGKGRGMSLLFAGL